MRRRAFTLAEILIASAVMLLVGTLGISLLQPAMASGARHSARAEMQQQASIAMDKICIDLERTVGGALSVFQPVPIATGATGLAMQRLAGFESTGDQLWEEQVRVYSWNPALQQLEFRQWSQGSPPPLEILLLVNQPARLGRSDFDALLRGKRPSAVLAQGVSNFTVSQEGLLVRLGLQLKRLTPGKMQPELFELQRALTLPNSVT